jgi:uncharacterized protein YbbK (DUF523 family)
MTILVSACLIGINCRYDGKHSFSRTVMSFVADKRIIPVCPELLGGLGVPRVPCRFSGGDGEAVLSGTARVIDNAGNDLTECFIEGAQRALAAALAGNVDCAILNERSPSCGVLEVYIGDNKCPGAGVTTALLIREGIRVISDEDI